jgi:putative acetyltransferase
MAERDVFVAISDGQLIGTVSLGREKLYSLFVKPQLQGRSVGARLIDHLESHAWRRE